MSVRNSVRIRLRFTGTTEVLVGFYVMVSGFIGIRNERTENSRHVTWALAGQPATIRSHFTNTSDQSR